MLSDLYVFGDSPFHRVRPLVKIIALIVTCTSLFVFEGWPSVLIGAAMVLTGFAIAGLKPHHAIASLRPALWVLAAIFAVQIYFVDIVFASFVVGRFAVLILAAALVTLTTRSSEFVAGILAGLKHAPAWVPKYQIALAISLCMRFIPLIKTVLGEIHQAQAARGLDRNILAHVVPLIIRTLKTADEVSQAIHSRSFD